MGLKTCEFEEAEYRGPLFNQLQTTSLLWEPGQVFEKHIGIDHALWTTHAYLHSLHGHSAPLSGAALSRYRWDYIWTSRKTKKKLPSFKLNVFIQAKRPQYGRYAPKSLRENGLKSPYWRFELTPHQQIALERLQSNLKNKALVCYACPVFHKEAVLHKWTIEPRIVENSTFPDADTLTGHSAWNFSEPGTKGVANADPAPSDGPAFLERVRAMVEREQTDGGSPVEELQALASAVSSAMDGQGDQALAAYAQFAEGVRTIESIADDMSTRDEGPAIVAYGTVMLFAQLNRLNWFVAGSGG